MAKYNWREDPELCVWLSDSAPAPKAVTGPKFYSQYKFVVRRDHGIEINRFVPDWPLSLICKMLDNDSTVKDYFYEQTFKGNIH